MIISINYVRRCVECNMQIKNCLAMCIATPFEIIRTISAKTMEIRAMDSVKKNPNSFEQDYHYSSNTNNPVVRIRKQKNGSWIADRYKWTSLLLRQISDIPVR